jgi:5-methylcytosine-specific restriction endonuclease McrA
LSSHDNKEQTRQETLGKIFKTNFYGDVEVVEYGGNRDIVIKFINTGYSQKVQLDALRKGLIHDLQYKADWIDAHKENGRINRELKKRLEATLKQQAILLREQELTVRAANRKKRKEDAALAEIQRKWDRRFYCGEEYLIGKKYVDRLGMTYTVLDRVGIEDVWIVSYDISGNTYEFSTSAVVTQRNAYDKDSAEYPILYKLYLKNLSTKNYEENLDKRRKQASDWQRANPEKAQHRNRHRRAKREQIGGTHTTKEINMLFERQGGKCACCGVELGKLHGKHLDHIMPVTLNGTNSIENLQWLCQFCNNSKGGKHPDDWFIYSSSEDFRLRREARLLLTTPPHSV